MIKDVYALKLKGKSYDEIAKELGMTRGQVSGYLHRHTKELQCTSFESRVAPHLERVRNELRA